MRRSLASRSWLVLLQLAAAVVAGCGNDCPKGTMLVGRDCRRIGQLPSDVEATPDAGPDARPMSCEPGKEHKCQGASLLVCDRKGQRFVAQSECNSAAACDAARGSCQQEDCDVGSYRCDNDILLHCELTVGWTFVAQCDEGQCDASQKACPRCAPGEKKCEGDEVLVCDQAGQNFDRLRCDGERPFCSAGVCVRCAEGEACAMNCQTTQCTAGACQTMPLPDLEPCTLTDGRSGVCASGMCMSPKSADGKDHMTRGERLYPGESLSNGPYRLVYQNDGDLVLFHDDMRIWDNLAVTLPPQTPAGHFGMETDGNAVIHNADGKPIWRTGTGCFGQSLALQRNGDVCIYNADNHVVWCAGTAGR